MTKNERAAMLKRILKQQGMTIYRLAKDSGLSRQGLLNIIAAEADPRVSTVIKIEDTLKIQRGTLL